MTILQGHHEGVLKSTLPHERAGVFSRTKPERVSPHDYISSLESQINEAALIEVVRPDIPILADIARKDIARQLTTHYSPDAILGIIDEYNETALLEAEEQEEQQDVRIITGVDEDDPIGAAQQLANQLVDDVIHTGQVYELAAESDLSQHEQLDSGEIIVTDFDQALGEVAVRSAQDVDAA